MKLLLAAPLPIEKHREEKWGENPSTMVGHSEDTTIRIARQQKLRFPQTFQFAVKHLFH